MNPRMRKRIGEQLETVSDLLEARIGLAAETGVVVGLAELAETQRHLAATSDGKPSKAAPSPAEPDEQPPPSKPAETRSTDDGVLCVRMPPPAQWGCPFCGEGKLLVTDGIKSTELRPFGDIWFCIADHPLTCSSCTWAGPMQDAADRLTE